MVLPSHTAKVQWLVEMLPILTPLGRCLIFVSTRAECDNLSRIVEVKCCHKGGDVDATPSTTTIIVSIHGEKAQHERNSAISKFKKNLRSVLIATDVAARGLDISDVMVVVNFDAAKNLDAHVHRVGRAGRLRANKGITACSSIDTTTDAAATTGEQQQQKQQQQHQRGVAYTLLTEKDANFATSLAEAFDREGREISPELAQLCQKSSRYGGGRVKHSKDGLGFGIGKAAIGSTAGTSTAAAAGGANVSHYYGPTQNTSNHHQPQIKRSRWNS